MRILGIDPGLAIVGYGIIDCERGISKAVDYGVINTPKGEKLPARLHMIYDGVAALIDKYQPDCMAIEELFFTKNVTTGIAVAEARGVILLCAYGLRQGDQATDTVYGNAPAQAARAP